MNAEDYKQEMFSKAETFFLLQITSNDLYPILIEGLMSRTFSREEAKSLLRITIIGAYAQGGLDASEIIKRDMKHD